MNDTASENRSCTFWCAGIWPFLVFPALLLLAVAFWHWHAIEKDVADNARAALAETHAWARVETLNRGRDVLLLGTAPDQQHAQSATTIVASATGVRRVDFIGELAESASATVPPANLVLTVRDGQLLGRGNVGSWAEKQYLLKRLQAQTTTSASAPNEDAFTVTSGLAPLPELPQLGKLIDLLPEFASIDELRIADAVLIVSGVVRSEQSSKDIEARFKDLWSGPIRNNLKVEIPACIAGVTGLLETTRIQFASDSAVIKPESEALLDQISSGLQQCDNVEFVVFGHTDHLGDSAYNLRLSSERAEAVARQLVSSGLARNRFEVRGMGSQQPVASNDTAEGRAQNRRIEFRAVD